MCAMQLLTCEISEESAPSARAKLADDVTHTSILHAGTAACNTARSDMQNLPMEPRDINPRIVTRKGL